MLRDTCYLFSGLFFACLMFGGLTVSIFNCALGNYVFAGMAGMLSLIGFFSLFMILSIDE
jgi:hypothetical protein